eukprot:15467868-Alexandrium_andersonii.AAC.1
MLFSAPWSWAPNARVAPSRPLPNGASRPTRLIMLPEAWRARPWIRRRGSPRLAKPPSPPPYIKLVDSKWSSRNRLRPG